MYWGQTAKICVLLPELKAGRRGVGGRPPFKFEMRSVHATRNEAEIRLRGAIQRLQTVYQSDCNRNEPRKLPIISQVVSKTGTRSCNACHPVFILRLFSGYTVLEAVFRKSMPHHFVKSVNSITTKLAQLLPRSLQLPVTVFIAPSASLPCGG